MNPEAYHLDGLNLDEIAKEIVGKITHTAEGKLSLTSITEKTRELLEYLQSLDAFEAMIITSSRPGPVKARRRGKVSYYDSRLDLYLLALAGTYITQFPDIPTNVGLMNYRGYNKPNIALQAESTATILEMLERFKEYLMERISLPVNTHIINNPSRKTYLEYLAEIVNKNKWNKEFWAENSIGIRSILAPETSILEVILFS